MFGFCSGLRGLANRLVHRLRVVVVVLVCFKLRVRLLLQPFVS